MLLSRVVVHEAKDTVTPNKEAKRKKTLVPVIHMYGGQPSFYFYYFSVASEAQGKVVERTKIKERSK